MSEKQYRTCVRMSEQEYQMLRNSSKKADMSMNRYLLTQLQAHPPLCYRKEEMEKLVDDLNHSGQIINEIAKSFNSGCGSEAQLQEVWRQLLSAVRLVHAVREMGYPNAV